MPVHPSLSEQFILLFNNLKAAAGNNPERMRAFSHDHNAIRSAWQELDDFLAHTDLERRIFGASSKVVHVSRPFATFEDAWKEYMDKWRSRFEPDQDLASRFALTILDLDAPFPNTRDGTLANQHAERTTPDSLSAGRLVAAPWREEQEPEPPDPENDATFDPLHHDGEAAIELGTGQWESGLNWTNDWTSNSCSLALGAYDYLVGTIGLDIGGVFRRWRRLPVVFMPAHVSNRYGASDKGSVLHLLDEAVRAYVFGAPAAALAMCRAAFEMILKQHYAQGELQHPKTKLAKVVAFADARGFIRHEQIKPLIDRADGILHRYAQEAVLSPEDERALLIFLSTLKSLIEGAPEQ